MTTPGPLDPDQVECRRCDSGPGAVCLTPSGAKSRTIHVERRRDAAAGRRRAPRPRDDQEPTPPNPASRKIAATPESRARGGKAAAQARRRRAAEIRAKAQAETDALRAQAEAAQAAKIAADAVRYDTDRALLRRQVLDGATKSYTRLIEGLDGLQRVAVDEEGRPIKVAEEYEDRDGRTRTRLVPDVRGAFSAAHVERLAKIAASTVNTLRLEEGKATGITETREGETVAGILGDAGVEELLDFAARNLPRTEGPPS